MAIWPQSRLQPAVSKEHGGRGGGALRACGPSRSSGAPSHFITTRASCLPSGVLPGCERREGDQGAAPTVPASPCSPSPPSTKKPRRLGIFLVKQRYSRYEILMLTALHCVRPLWTKSSPPCVLSPGPRAELGTHSWSVSHFREKPAKEPQPTNSGDRNGQLLTITNIVLQYEPECGQGKNNTGCKRRT